MDARKRSEAIQPRLTVRRNRAGEPVWNAVWRDSTGRSVMRAVGKAWLDPVKVSANPFVAADEAKRRAQHAREAGLSRWQEEWVTRNGNAKGGLLKSDAALKRANELVIDRELERDELHERLQRSRDPRTFGAVAEAWLREKAAEVKDGTLKPSTLRDYSAMLARPKEDGRARARIMRRWADTPPRHIDRKDVEAFLDELRDTHGLTARTRHKYSIVLSQVFDHARRKEWVTVNPLADRSRTKKGKRARKHIVVYSVEQVEAIARKAGGQDGEIIRLAAYAGLRQGELLALRWRDIDWTGSAIRVVSNYVHGIGEGTPKSGEARAVPLGRQAAEVLERVSKRETGTAGRDLVFPGRIGGNMDPSSFRKRYVKARDAAAKDDGDLPALTFHELRHTFGSRLAAGNVPLRAIQEFMGHADIQTTAVYLHFVDQGGYAADVTDAFDRHRSVLEQAVEVASD